MTSSYVTEPVPLLTTYPLSSIEDSLLTPLSSPYLSPSSPSPTTHLSLSPSPAPSSSTISTSSSSSSPISTPLQDALTISSANLSLFFSSESDCSCDLYVQSCDLECCCDSDCSENEVEVFSQCINDVDSSDTRQCIGSNIIFRTSFSHTVSSELFCIYTDNYPGRMEFSSLDVISSENDIDSKLAIHSNAWDLATPPHSFNPLQTEFYRSGDPIQISYISGGIGYLSLPSPLNGELCHDGNPITYLNELSQECVRYISDDSICSSSSSLNSQIYYQNITLLSSPSSNIKIPITIQTLTCYNLIGQQVSCDIEDPPEPYFDNLKMTCNNIVLKVDYTIFHNTSQGILSAHVNIITGSVTIGPVVQSFSVKFKFVGVVDNVTDNIVKRSGNPGYIDGQPVIAGVLTGDRIEVEVNSGRWLSLLKQNTMGECSDQREGVKFKDKTHSSCILRVPMLEIMSGCSTLGNQTLVLLLGAEPQNNRIAIYGNSDINDISHWVELIGVGGAPNHIGCSSIVTGIQLLIFYSYTGQLNSPQAVITGSEIRYLTQDITTLCTGPTCSHISIILDSDVTFIPVYTSPEEVLLSTTLTTRSLPHDFLYPLFTGRGDRQEYKCGILILLCVISMIFI